MKKKLLYISMLSIILLIVSGINVTSASASGNSSLNAFPDESSVLSNNEASEYEPYAISRKITEYVVHFETFPPNTYYYSDSLGYSGMLSRDEYYKIDGRYHAIYSGTVTCQGLCPGVNTSANQGIGK